MSTGETDANTRITRIGAFAEGDTDTGLQLPKSCAGVGSATGPRRAFPPAFVPSCRPDSSPRKEPERKRLEAQYGRVWDTDQLSQEFEVLGFMAPYVVVRRKSDGRKGSLAFQHLPRFYFNFVLD
jgi:hypothetical protein